MSYILNASPGQAVTIVLETLLSDGYRSDGYFVGDGYDMNTGYHGSNADGYGIDGYYNLPLVQRIIMPSMALAGGYPQQMRRIDTGLYYFQFTLPTGASAVGTYIVDIEYVNPNTSNYAEIFYQVIVTAPYGQYSVGTF